ncbi:hypothetical protein [Sphaerisporangium sp. NPDC051011]|uniref:hypothetical protein n=1 Tax=Sphaerisporangium sp. NPDC051011 TaxID=3155792 RepID=UPI0033C92A43
MITSAQEFLSLRFSDDPAEYNRAAREPAPLEVWLELINDHPEARFWVAHNKTVPIEVLRLLATDADWRVRSMVASKNKAPSDVLERLSTDEHDAIRQTVAGHPNTPTETVLSMCDDHWDEIRATARRNLSRRGCMGSS